MQVFNTKPKQDTVNEYINIADVRNEILYTKDGYMFMYIKVQPISTALMTDTEKQHLTEQMTRELSPLGIPFKILFISRPTDVRQVIEYYEGVKSVTVDTKKRDNLTKTIRFFSKLSNTAGVLERQTFFSIWTKTNILTEELYSKASEFVAGLINSGVNAHICSTTEITNMLSLFYNPTNSSALPVITTPNYTFLNQEVII